MSMILHFAKTRPFVFGVGFSCVKTSLSDLVVQKLVEERERIDWRRNAAFAAFGFGYLGMIQYSLYVPIFGRLFPRTQAFAAKSISEKVKDPRGMAGVVAQVFLDQAVHHPFAYFPAFYITKEVVTAKNGHPDISRALGRWQENFWPDLFALWKIWVPATLMNFAFSPMWMRIPVVASTSLAWTMVLSAMRGAEKTEAELQGIEPHVPGVANNSDVVLFPEEQDNPVLGGHVSARTMEIFARGLARRGVVHSTKTVLSDTHTKQSAKHDEATGGTTPETTETTSSGQQSPALARRVVRRLTGDPASEDESHLCVTASGPDRVGIVSLLTHWIYERGGNITDSKMLRMNDEFIVIMHVTGSYDLRGDLLRDPEKPKPVSNLDLRVREIGHHASDAQHKREARLRLTGRDQPGIVFKVTQMFSDLGFNIDELATDTVPSSAASTPWFLLEVFATSPNDSRKQDLDARIQSLKDELGVNIEITWTR